MRMKSGPGAYMRSIIRRVCACIAAQQLYREQQCEWHIPTAYIYARFSFFFLLFSFELFFFSYTTRSATRAQSAAGMRRAACAHTVHERAYRGFARGSAANAQRIQRIITDLAARALFLMVKSEYVSVVRALPIYGLPALYTCIYIYGRRESALCIYVCAGARREHIFVPPRVRLRIYIGYLYIYAAAAATALETA